MILDAEMEIFILFVIDKYLGNVIEKRMNHCRGFGSEMPDVLLGAKCL